MHDRQLSFTGDAHAALVKLKQLISAMPGAKVTAVDKGYLYAEFPSTFFRFVDDVEFLIDPASGTIHFRSASRAGRSDLGVNRRRLEAIHKAWDAGS